MSNVPARPISWNDLPDIDDVDELTDEDFSCLAEVQAVLERHGRTERFGVSLLHSHFPVAEDEMLLEQVDVEKRTLVTKPIQFAKLGDRKPKATVWRFKNGELRVASTCAGEYVSAHWGYKED